MHGGREMRKAMSVIAAAFRGFHAPEDARPVGLASYGVQCLALLRITE